MTNGRPSGFSMSAPEMGSVVEIRIAWGYTGKRQGGHDARHRGHRRGTVSGESVFLHKSVAANPSSGHHGRRFHPTRRGGDRFGRFSATRGRAVQPADGTTRL